MIRSPKEALTRIGSVSDAWGSLRPAKSFANMTHEQFRQEVKASYDVRAELEDLERRAKAALKRRTLADAASLSIVQTIVHAVKADREEGGEDGELYAAMGFVSKSERSSGLTRRREQPDAKAEGGGMS
jgi:hypothetical protein